MNPASVAPLPSFWRRFWPPLGLGLLGVLALGWQIQAQLGGMALPPEFADVPRPVLWLVALAGPIVLVTLGSLLGAGLAHRVGLRSGVAGTAAPGGASLGRALGVGLLLALLLFAVDRLLRPWLPPAEQALMAGQLGSGGQILVALLYGGLTEEVMVRWGLLSLIAWALFRLGGGQRPLGAGLFWTANALAALLFALGHLPALYAAMEPSTLLLARTVALNAMAGLVYGWLFRRHQLETAMAAHAATHLGFWLLAALLR